MLHRVNCITVLLEVGGTTSHGVHHGHQCALVLCPENLGFVSEVVALCNVLKQAEALNKVFAAHLIIDNVLETQLGLNMVKDHRIPQSHEMPGPGLEMLEMLRMTVDGIVTPSGLRSKDVILLMGWKCHSLLDDAMVKGWPK